MPVDKELIGKKLIVVELVAESGGKFLHLRVEVDEELASCLEKVLATFFLVLGHKLLENRLKSIPMLHDVAMLAKNTLHGNEHLVLARHVELELKLANLAHDIIRGASPLVRNLLIHKGLQLLACLHYNFQSKRERELEIILMVMSSH